MIIQYTLANTILVALVAAQSALDFPIVDLGYTKHRATQVNQTVRFNISYATYANIRFAQPPVGPNRFRKPRLPPPRNTTVQDGVVPRNSTDCVNAIPAYLPIAPGVNGTSWGSEDCLFLDVKVPEGLSGRKVPVLHWLYGGGYIFGSKNDWAGDPAGLFQDMAVDQKFIVVSSNYRLSALGWMSSETEPSIDKNIGLWDGLAALEWTKSYISQFGGDPNNITVIGESAGGGIAQHLVTAWAGKDSVPFRQAILTSPGYRPHINRTASMTAIYRRFLNSTNCGNATCLRSLPSSEIVRANRDLLAEMDGGWIGPDTGFGPIIDGGLVPDLPDRLLAQGYYQKGVKRVIAANMALDGLGGTTLNPKSWREQLNYYMKSPTDRAVNIASSTWGANVTVGSILFNGDAIYACHSFWTAQAVANQSSNSAFRYSMSIPPATHGQDQFYYFYRGNADNAAVNYTALARQMQAYFRNFIFAGNPASSAGVTWPPYGREGKWMNITTDGFRLVGEESAQAQRCNVLKSLINDPANGF